MENSVDTCQLAIVGIGEFVKAELQSAVYEHWWGIHTTLGSTHPFNNLWLEVWDQWKSQSEPTLMRFLKVT